MSDIEKLSTNIMTLADNIPVNNVTLMKIQNVLNHMKNIEEFMKCSSGVGLSKSEIFAIILEIAKQEKDAAEGK